MSLIRRITTVGRYKCRMAVLAAAMSAGCLVILPVYGATFGHSRLLSEVGEPLRIEIPVTQLSADDAATLRVVPAPASAWLNAGLVPPVDTARLKTRLVDGYSPGTRIIQVWSDLTFNRPIADLLLDIHTASGVQRYQVSLLARGGTAAVQAPSVQTSRELSDVGAVQPAGQVSRSPILVRRGDTMFSLAQRHAVPGVTVYQMMIALQRANPQAFIHQNVNLVKAGEHLVIPDFDALTAISDREARRLFHEQVVAFNAYRQGEGSLAVDGTVQTPQVTQVAPDVSASGGVSNIPEARAAEGDQLKLSSGRTVVASAAGSSSGDMDNSLPQARDGTNAGSIEANSPAATSQTSVSSSDGAPASNNASGVNPSAQAALAAAGDGISSGLPLEASAGANGTALQASATGAADDGSRADDAMATRKAIEDAEARVSMLEENVKNLNRALQSQGEAAIDVVVDGAIGLRQSLTDVATAVTDATIGDEDTSDDLVSAADGAQTSTLKAHESAAIGMMESISTWVHANFLGVMAAILALVVLIIAWVLRRANLAKSRTESAVTPEMVKEKLNQINLDLKEPTIDESTRGS